MKYDARERGKEEELGLRPADNPARRPVHTSATQTEAGQKGSRTYMKEKQNVFLTLGRRTRSLFYLSILAFVLMLFVFFWVLMQSRRSTPRTDMDRLRTELNLGFRLNGAEAESIYPFGAKTLIRLNSGQISLLNSEGKEQMTMAMDCENPQLVQAYGYALVFDLGGKKFYLLNKQGLIYEGSTNEAIGYANVSKNGHVALVMNQANTRGVLRVLDPEGIHLFDYEIRERKNSGYILSVRFSDDGQYIDASMLNTDGVEPFPIITRIDLMTAKVSEVYLCDTNEALSILALGAQGRLIAAGNRSVYRLVGEQMSLWMNFADIKEVVPSATGICLLAADSVKGEAHLVYQNYNDDLGDLSLGEMKSVAVGVSPHLLQVAGEYALVADNTVCYKVKLSDLSFEKKDFGSEIVRLGLEPNGQGTVVCKDRVAPY